MKSIDIYFFILSTISIPGFQTINWRNIDLFKLYVSIMSPIRGFLYQQGSILLIIILILHYVRWGEDKCGGGDTLFNEPSKFHSFAGFTHI